MAVFGSLRTVATVERFDDLVGLGVAGDSAEMLCNLVFGPGNVLAVSGDVVSWFDVVSVVARPAEVRVFSPGDGKWSVSELHVVVAASLVSTDVNGTHIVVTEVDTLTGGGWDKLLKTLESSKVTFWLCAGSVSGLPVTVLGRCSHVVNVDVGLGSELAETLSGSGFDPKCALAALHGRVGLVANAARFGLFTELRIVESVNGRCFSNAGEAWSFLNAFAALCLGKGGVDAVWGWSALKLTERNLCRVELARWFSDPGVLVRDADSALLVGSLSKIFSSVRDMLLRNVAPMHALSPAVVA